MIYPDHLKDLSGAELKAALQAHRRKEIIKLICRQTDYSEEKATERLIFWKENYLYVLKEYMNPTFDPSIKKSTSLSMNQRVFGEIRNFMNQGEKLLAFRKKRQRYIQQLITNKKKEEEEEKNKLKAIDEGNKKMA